jgi:hypothetical protein
MELSAEWIVERNEGFDLYAYGREVLDLAINNLIQDDELTPAAFVITKNEIHCVATLFATYEEKEELFEALVGYALKIGAVAIVTMNDAYCGKPEDAENYYPGKLKEIGSEQCIMVSISGPCLKNWVIEAHYEMKNGKYIFQLPIEESGGEIGLLNGWAEDIKSVN